MADTLLSIIIPVLNEAEALPHLLSDLAGQQGVVPEVIIVDGGSTDGTVAIAESWFDTGKLQGECLITEAGRGRQLNAGVSKAASEWLLFIHADSRFTGKLQLHEALEVLKAEIVALGNDAVAGRFQLRFDIEDRLRTLAYSFYEDKARLGRPGCIHGDQGMLMTASFFKDIGPFREDLPVMEDTSLAESIRHRGRWLLLPSEVITSSRRFLVEGLKPRQILNALMMNFLAIGWLDFIYKAPELYRQQSGTQRLELRPFFRLISTLLGDMTFKRRWQLWLATGTYVRSQAWQLGLLLDCRRQLAGEMQQDEGFWLKWFDRWFEPVTNNYVGRCLTALLVRAWFAFH